MSISNNAALAVLGRDTLTRFSFQSVQLVLRFGDKAWNAFHRKWQVRIGNDKIGVRTRLAWATIARDILCGRRHHICGLHRQRPASIQMGADHMNRIHIMLCCNFRSLQGSRLTKYAPPCSRRSMESEIGVVDIAKEIFQRFAIGSGIE